MEFASSLNRIVYLLWLANFPANGRLPRKVITIDGNGYQGVTIAISQSLPEKGNEKLVQNLKDLFTATSEQLFKATKNNLYFKHITIVVPRTWTRKPDYKIVSGPQFDMSHVIIGERNPLFGSNPYVFGVTGCSEEGQSIHIDMYTVLSNWKARLLDKFLVHQWGHYRWGIFDEYPGTESPTLKPEKPYYMTNGMFRPNVCSEKVQGEFLLNCIDPNSKCKVMTNGLLEPGCQFCEDQSSRAKQSLMGYYYLNSVTQFCDDVPANGTTEVHNVNAETKQNKYCKGKSNWAVMREHQDFKGLKAGPKSMDTTPSFDIVQQGMHRVVLILDISGSMKTDSKLEKLLQATTHFLLNVVDDDTEVGLVTFSRSASIVKPMTRMSSQQVREQFVASLPTVADGATSIGAGIIKGIQCLTASSGVTKGSLIFIVSDGKETTDPYLKSVTAQIEQSGVTVMSLAFTDKSDIKMVKLSGDTGGRSFLESNKDDSTVLVDAFYQSIGHTADEMKTLVLIESRRTTPANNLITGSFHIDGGIGRDTLLAVIGSNANSVTINVSSPNGTGYQISTCRPRVCTLKLPGILETGKYTFTIRTPAGGSYVYTIQSRQRSQNDKIITAKAWMSGPSLNLGATSSLKVFTSVTKGYGPVLNAKVRAVVDSSKNDIILVDIGSGADLQADDGIYSAYILPSHVTGNGRFNGRVEVENKDGTAKSIVPVSRKRRDIYQFTSSLEWTTANIDKFERTTQTSEFEVLNFADAAIDKIPPARITTLELAGTDPVSRTFRLQFLAVGDDHDIGNATSYDVRISSSAKELLMSPSNATRIDSDDIPTPTVAGTLQSLKVSVEESSVTYFVGIRAVDSNNNTGEMSNIVSLSIVYGSSNALLTSLKLNIYVLIMSVLFY